MGYRACRKAGAVCRACVDAKTRYEKRTAWDRKQGRPHSANPLGVQRRLQALMALGHTALEIAEAAGWTSHQSVTRVLQRETVYLTTVRRVEAAYRQLSMKPGRSEETRRRALAAGWVPPLAWDDIDTDAHPHKSKPMRFVDEVVVQQAMAGQRVKANRLERLEVVRRWEAAGRSLSSLAELQGWQLWRDAKLEAARASAA